MVMSKGDLISVLLPCYNIEPKIFTKSINSVLNQTYDNLELIIITDYYDKQTNELIRTTLDENKDDKRILPIFHKGRIGLVNSLNEGIRKSNGSYIARLDSDDVCHKKRLEKQITLMNDENYPLTGTWAYLSDMEGINKIDLKKPVENDIIRRSIMMYNPFIHSTIMIKKTVLYEVGLYDHRFPFSEDYELWLRIISKGYLAKNIPEFLLTQYINKESVTRKHWIKNRLTFIKCKYYAYLKYRYNAPGDILGLLSSPLALIMSPNLERHLKRLTNRMV